MRAHLDLAGRIQSFRYAFRGIRWLMATQPNAWIHAAATILVIIAGFYFRLNRLEWCAILLACGLVWMAEGLNTAFEFLADAVSPERHPLVGKAKDVSAAGVLLSAIAAAATGLVIFIPHL